MAPRRFTYPEQLPEDLVLGYRTISGTEFPIVLSARRDSPSKWVVSRVVNGIAESRLVFSRSHAARSHMRITASLFFDELVALDAPSERDAEVLAGIVAAFPEFSSPAPSFERVSR